MGSIKSRGVNDETKIEESKRKSKEAKEEAYENYPSIELAYSIAEDSFDLIVKRIDALDGKIQNLTVASITLFFAIPVLAKTQSLDTKSYWFYVALVFIVFSVILSIMARIYGTVKLIDPNILFERWLHLPTKQFQSDYIHFAGKAFEANNKVLNRKWYLNIASMAIYALALAALVIWVSHNPSSHP